MIPYKLIALSSLLPSLALAQVDAGTGDRNRQKDAEKERDEARERERAKREESRRQAEKMREESRRQVEQMREDARRQAEQIREHSRQLREATRDQMKMVHEQMKEVSRQMREEARQLQRKKLYPRLGLVVKSDTGSAEAAKGVMVQEVNPGPAQKAGIQAGDILTAINGQPLAEPADASVQSYAHAVGKLMALLYASKKGEKVKIDYERGSQKRHAEVELEADGFGWEEMAHQIHLPAFWMDIELVPINRDLGEYFGTDHGLLVVRGSTAHDLKLKGGDIILRIGDQQPQTPFDAVRLLRHYDGKAIPVQILRHKKNETLTIQPK